MRTVQLGLASLALILSIIGGPQVALGEIITGPFEWSLGSGGNGHFYQLINHQAAISWHDARDDAASRVLNGSPGHLVTITSSAESAFLQSTFQSFIGDPNTNVPGVYAWIGLSDEASEGTFAWVTSEPFGYSNWAPFEPNNLDDEDFIAVWRRNFGSGPLWSWNDFDPIHNAPVYGGYLVEFDGPFAAPVPEPASMLAWGLIAGVGAVGYRLRKRKVAAAV